MNILKGFRYLILSIIFVSTNICYAQSSDNQFFKTGDRVCFVGNSITNNGDFHHNILLYYITRFPEQQVTFFNCGISGDVTGGVLNRMEDDILIHNPTHAVVMIGMNDVRRSLYTDKISNSKDTLLLREKAINTYKINLEKIIKTLISKNIKVILQKPTIYDQTSILKTPNNLGVNDALKVCGNFVDSMSVKYKLQLVDYWTVLQKINTELQKTDSTATITGADRVHPGYSGHFVMAYTFLKSQNLPSIVSKINIDSKAHKITKSENCTIDKLSINNEEIRFAVKENALPFPTTSNQVQGLQLVPFTNELNKELLQLSELKSGYYNLLIDDILIGKFSNDQLADGVNLALFSNTPQYQQALKVRAKLTELWKLESLLRSIKFIEYCNDLKSCPEKVNPEGIVNFLKPILDKKNSVFYTMQLNNYAENKAKESDLVSKSDELRKKTYEMAQPIEHTFSIVSANK